MKYIEFNIKNYRGIVEPLKIKIKEGSPIALVGFNESGKSTIIDAIYAFDFENDDSNEKYKQLDNISNLYAYYTSEHEASISANILIENDEDYKFLLSLIRSNNGLKTKEIEETIEVDSIDLEENAETENIDSTQNVDSQEDGEPQKILTPQYKIIKKEVLVEEDENKQLDKLKKSIKFIEIERVINKQKESHYVIRNLDNIPNDIFDIDQISLNQEEIAKKIVEHLPTMLYVREFDTFKEDIILRPNPQQKKAEKEYRELFNNLFLSATGGTVSLDKYIELPDTRESQPILNRVTQFLNEEFTKRWTKFNMEHNFSDLELKLIHNEGKLKISVAEKVKNDTFSFNISDRSSGFKWYFNFIMRTLFNPIHKNGNNNQTLYLMDEPGTFLHESSQKSFAQELKDIIKGNYLIYTTHHFQMINLKNISLNNIYIVEKFNKLVVAEKSTHYTGYNNDAKKGAMLPIFHSLRFTFVDMIRDEQNKNKKFLIVEGLHDYYFINLFIKKAKILDNIEIYPSVGADQIYSNIPEFNFYNNGVYALFDNDQKGCIAKDEFLKLTNKEYENRVFVLPFSGYQEDNTKSFTMNDIFGQDLLNDIYNKIIEKGLYIPQNNYKCIMECLYENRELCNITNSNADFKSKVQSLQNYLVEKLK